MSSFANRLRIAVLLLAVAVLVPAVALAGDSMNTSATKTTNSSAKQKSLYTRLGGKKGITSVVNEFVTRIGADTRVNSFFAATTSDPARLAKFKQHFVEQLCQASGGPCKYTGKDMKTAHQGMKITTENFNAVVEDLTGALDKFKIGETEKNQLLGVLGPMKADIAGTEE